MVDTHTHTTYSFDGEASPEQMIAAAVLAGVEHYAITEHLERDESIEGYYGYGNLNVSDYIINASAEREKMADKIQISLGLEAGFTPHCADRLAAELERKDLDLIINSTHCACNRDVYDKEYFENFADRKSAYRCYLEAVLLSLDAPFDYDIVGHIGYVSRRAPYAEKSLIEAETGDIIADILKTIIKKDKCLEINSNTSNRGLMPEKWILKRYFELGGRRVSFGSDAHKPAHIAENYAIAKELCKEIGFTGFTYYVKRKPYLFAF